MRSSLIVIGILFVISTGCGGDKQEQIRPAAEEAESQPAAGEQPGAGVQLRTINNKETARQLGTKLNIQQQRQRQTPKTDFGTKLEQGLGKTADTPLSAGEVAAPMQANDTLSAPAGN